MKKKRNAKLLFGLASTGLMLLSGCQAASETSSDSSSHDSGSEVLNEKHRFDATPTSNPLIQGGRTSYKIVLSSESDEQLTYARAELTSLFKEATNIDLPVVYDTDLTYKDTDTYISLGKNDYWESASLGEETNYADYGRDGVRILTKGKSIFIFGETNYGTLYGVYDFLHITFDFETYYEDRYTLDKNVKDLPLYDYDVVDIPDLSFRQKRGLLNPTASQNQMFGWRMRVMDDVSELILPIYENDTAPTGSFNRNHNSFHYFPKSVFLDKENHPETYHPKFYSTSGDQLCFTAHGDEEELEKMVGYAAKKIENSLTWFPTAQYPKYNTAFLGMMDVPDLCGCEACAKVKESHNNAIVSTVILFMKRVGKAVNAWMELPENAAYKRDLTYGFFAYQAALTPPFKGNKDGTFDYNPDIIPDEGVKLMPYVASMSFDYGRSFYSSPNDETRQLLKAWGNFYPGTWAWSYGGFFNDYITFYDIYNFYEDYHEYLTKYHYSLSFEQVKNDQRGADPGFGGLANYVLCKKSWNASLDMNELIDDYIETVYEDAAPAMKEMFLKLRLWFAKIIEKNGIGNGGSMQADISTNKKYWGFGLIDELFELCDKAYDAIAIYQNSDAAKYKRLKNYIDIEWLVPAKVAIGCYEDKFTANEYVNIKRKFKEICLDNSIKDIKEFVSINSYLDSLGV
ncbi:MAG TPA: hypothetical protein DCZ41_02265 [Firmicutes bacterium]|nr:hypothetical protein [Bacillota bacterium]